MILHFFHQFSPKNYSVNLVLSKTRLVPGNNSVQVRTDSSTYLKVQEQWDPLKGATLTYFIQDFVDRYPLCAIVASQ